MQKEKFVSWLLVTLCTSAIFLIVPVARTIQSFVQAHWGRSLFGYSVLAATGGTFLALLYVLFFQLKIRSLSNYIWLSVIACFYIYFTLKLWKIPEEAIHFLEYGLLGFFLFRALSLSIKDKSIYFSAFLFGSFVGIFDEILQWIVPRRFWDFRDVGLNALSSGLFQVAVWKGIKPKIISQKIGIKSVRILSFLLGINLILLGLCMSNTPQRVARYTKLIPSLSFLQREEVMNRFKYEHKDSDIGAFYSRLPLEELKKQDKENSTQYAQILKEWKEKDYKQFLANFHAFTHPFLHEIRAHLFSRDENFMEALNSGDVKHKRKFFFKAYKENLVLEKYFNQTINKSTYKWSKEKFNKAEALIDKNAPYTSRVSFNLLSSLSEKTIWATIFAFLILLALINFLLYRSRKFQQKSDYPGC